MNPDPSSINEASNQVRLFFILVSGLLIIGIAASYFAGRAALEAIARIREFDAAIETIQDLRSTVQDAETGQKGYLLTPEAKYLRPYEEAIATIQPRLQAVQKLAKAGIVSAEQVSELERLIATKIDELRKTVSLVQAGRMPAAMGIVRSDEGEQTMEAIRTTMAEIVSVQENGRGAASDRADATVQVRSWVILAALLGNLAFLLWAYHRIRREMMHHFVANLETRRRKEILSVTLASIGGAVIITDVRGRITSLNAIAEKLTGWTSKEAEDRPCAEVFRIVSEETRLPVESPIDKVLVTGAIVGLANHTLLIRRDGSELPIDDSGAPIRESDGTVRGVILIFFEILQLTRSSSAGWFMPRKRSRRRARPRTSFWPRFRMNCAHRLLRFWRPSPRGRRPMRFPTRFVRISSVCVVMSNWRQGSSTTCSISPGSKTASFPWRKSPWRFTT